MELHLHLLQSIQMNIHQKLDETIGVVFPYYTWPFLDVLNTWDVSSWDVFEYGAGYSTSWWRCKAKSITSIDNHIEWASRFRGVIHERRYNEYVGKPTTTGMKYDCIIIDGEPVEWRDACTEFALQALKPNGILIIDNYRQPSVDLGHWPQTDALLKSYEKHIFYQPGHPDWKTAYWTITPPSRNTDEEEGGGQ